MIRKPFYYLVPLAIFICLAVYILLGQYPDMLYTAQDRNEFFYSSTFFTQSLSMPTGLMIYLGSLLTQFFYYPVVGVSLLALLWCAIYGVTIKVFRLTDRTALLALLPLTCLLVSLIDLGYWIYILPFHGYWFSESLIVLCALLMLWASTRTPARHRAVWYIVGTLLAFPLIGWGSYLFTLCFLATQCVESRERRMPWWHHLCGLILALLVPFFYARFVFNGLHESVILKAGIPYFESTTVDALRPSWPFIILAVLLLLLSLGVQDCLSRVKLSRTSSQTKSSKVKTEADEPGMGYGIGFVATLAVMAGMVYLMAFRDYNYQAEMRMNQAAMNDDWDAILREAQKAEAPSRAMVLFQNIALMNKGELGERAFQMGNSGLDINNPDSLNLNVMQICVPMIYYQYGKLQFGIRWCMENFVSYGYTPYFMKMMVRCAQETGEHRLKGRYLHLLSLTHFHKDWRPLPTTLLVRDLHVAFSDVVDSDNNDLERYLIENFSNAFGSDKPLVKEINLFYAMLYRDPKLFWPSFDTFAQLFMMQHQREDGSVEYGVQMPTHYQEAYLIMQENYPVELPYKVLINPMVEQNYKLFKQAVNSPAYRGLSDKELGESLRGAWSHTYWWYIMYGRKSY